MSLYHSNACYTRYVTATIQTQRCWEPAGLLVATECSTSGWWRHRFRHGNRKPSPGDMRCSCSKEYYWETKLLCEELESYLRTLFKIPIVLLYTLSCDVFRARIHNKIIIIITAFCASAAMKWISDNSTNIGFSGFIGKIDRFPLCLDFSLW